MLCSGEGQVQRDGRQVAARPDGVSGGALRGESEGDSPPDGAGCSRERGRTVAGTTRAVQQRHDVGEQRPRYGRRRYVQRLVWGSFDCPVLSFCCKIGNMQRRLLSCSSKLCFILSLDWLANESMKVVTPCDQVYCVLIGRPRFLARNVFCEITYSISIRTILRVHIVVAHTYKCPAAALCGIFKFVCQCTFCLNSFSDSVELMVSLQRTV